MTILVTGATGFIGSHVARYLSDMGRAPRMMFRRPRRASMLKDLDGELVIADLDSRPSLRRAVDGVDAVIHLAGRATFEPYEVVAPTLVGGTRAMAEAAADAGVNAFVFASSAFVYPSVHGPITFDTDPHPLTGYGRAKLEAEGILGDISQTSGMRTAYPRLPHVYGAGSILFDYVEGGFVPFAGDMEATYSHLHVDDAVRVLVAAVDAGVEGAVPVGDENPVTWRTFFSTIQTYRPDVRVIDLPEGIIEKLLRLVEPVRRHTRASMITPDTVRGWRLDQAVDSEEAWRRLDIEPRHASIETGIPATLETILPDDWVHSVADRRR